MQIGNAAQTQTQVLMQFYVWSKYKIAPTNAIITVVLHLKQIRNHKCKYKYVCNCTFKSNSKANIGLMAPDNDIAAVVIFCYPRMLLIMIKKITPFIMMMIMVMLRIITIITTSTRLKGALKNVVMRWQIRFNLVEEMLSRQAASVCIVVNMVKKKYKQTLYYCI